MNIAYYFVIALHIIVCLLLIAVVLLQQGKGQDLASAFGGGGTQTAFGPRGSANVLSRATTLLAVMFMVTSLALTVLRPGSSSILDKIPATAPSPAVPVSSTPPVVPSTTAPAAPVASQPAASPAAQ